jgi:Glycosyl transferase family 2
MLYLRASPVHSVQPLPRLNEQPASDRWDGCVSVIVPVYNEVAHLEELLQAVLASPVKKEVIIVDDGSSDGTRDRLRALPLRNDLTIVFHEKNCGKGASIRTALAMPAANMYSSRIPIWNTIRKIIRLCFVLCRTERPMSCTVSGLIAPSAASASSWVRSS